MKNLAACPRDPDYLARLDTESASLDT